MANVSSSNGLEKRPALSFRDDCGAEFPSWQRTSLGTIIEPYSEKVHGEHDFEVLTSSREGLQRQIDHFGSQQRHDTDGYNIIPLGFCTYRNRSDDGRFTFNINKISDKAIVSKFYPVFRFKNANSTFMTEYLNSSARARKKLSVLAVGTSQVVLSFEALKSAKFDLPCKEEQDKIASLLECLNERIDLQRSFVDALKKYKRGVFEAFLAKKIRFTNRGTSFADWKWTTISEIGEFLGGLSGKTKDDFGHGSDRFITYMNVYKNAFATADGIMPVSIGSDERQNRIQYGDILFTQSSETVEEVGLSSVWLHNSKPYLNSFCMALRPNSLKQLNPKYLGYVMRSKSVRNQIMKEGQGISRINLSGNRILNVGFWCPSLDEQNKIVEVMESLDSICFLSDEKLTRLKDMKSSFIQQLFI